MINKIPLPTDNLYKFMALFGLTIYILSFIPNYHIHKLNLEVIETGMEIDKIIAEDNFFSDYYQKTFNEIASDVKKRKEELKQIASSSKLRREETDQIASVISQTKDPNKLPKDLKKRTKDLEERTKDLDIEIKDFVNESEYKEQV